MGTRWENKMEKKRERKPPLKSSVGYIIVQQVFTLPTSHSTRGRDSPTTPSLSLNTWLGLANGMRVDVAQTGVWDVLARFGFVSCVLATVTRPRQPLLLQPSPSEHSFGTDPQHGIIGRPGRAAANLRPRVRNTFLSSWAPEILELSVAILLQSYQINTQVKRWQEKSRRKEAENAGQVRKCNEMVEINPIDHQSLKHKWAKTL